MPGILNWGHLENDSRVYCAFKCKIAHYFPNQPIELKLSMSERKKNNGTMQPILFSSTTMCTISMKFPNISSFTFLNIFLHNIYWMIILGRSTFRNLQKERPDEAWCVDQLILTECQFVQGYFLCRNSQIAFILRSWFLYISLFNGISNLVFI